LFHTYDKEPFRQRVRDFLASDADGTESLEMLGSRTPQATPRPLYRDPIA